MKVLLSWLKEYTDIDVSPKELEEKLFSVGFEVESVRYLGENMEDVVVGQITAARPYEGTHLTICHVDCGDKGKDHLILTGATNIFAGAKVPTALVGAKLPCGLDIKPRKMVGMISYGMLCSGEELGIDGQWYPGADVDGIMILDDDAPVGTDMKEYLGLDDYLFDIAVTANRPDCQSVMGIAREVAAAFRKPFKAPDMSYETDGTFDPDISVTVKDDVLCPAYLGHYVYDVKDMQSPLWMKRRLIAVGHNAINAMVDITNYVMVETGQPMHAFDLDTLSGHGIVVRRAADNEEIVTLDGKKRALTHDNLLICDKEKPVGLAGVMGGLNSEITGSTRRVLFEAAVFKRDNIRKTSRSLGIASDAAACFEKGVNVHMSKCGLSRALNLVQKIGLAKISASHFEVGSIDADKPREIKVSVSKVNDVLGITVPEGEMTDILKALGFGVTLSGDEMTLQVPPYREDVEGYQDIAEEVIREYGYDKLKPTFLDDAAVTNGGMKKSRAKELAVKEYLCSRGYYEIKTMAMTGRGDFDAYLIPEDSSLRRAVKILNPITEKLEIMRTFLTPSMVRAIEGNIKNGHEATRFFEMANVYIPKALPLTEPPREKKTLCLGVCGGEEDFFSVKETLEGLAAFNGLKFKYEEGQAPYLHPGRCADIYCEVSGDAAKEEVCADEPETVGGSAKRNEAADGRYGSGKENGTDEKRPAYVKIGVAGQLRYEIVEGLNIALKKKSDVTIFIAEIDYDALSALFKKDIKYVPDPGFIKASRDISFLIGKDVPCGKITEAISACDSRIKKVSLFDVFESEKLGEGLKSMAFNLRIESDEGDVTDKTADEIFMKVADTLKSVFDAKIRA